MKLVRLAAKDFRNLADTVLEPDDRLTVLCGANGQGKTNLLEAVWLLTGAKSFRTGKDAELIRHGAAFSVLEATFEGGGRAQTLRLTVGGPDTQRPGRTARLNEVDCGRAAGVAGTFTAVVFTPDHLRLVKDGPAGRRRFLDAALCQCQPAHLAALRRYQRALSQKNALLKHFADTKDADLLLDTLNDALAQAGGAVMERRAWFMRQLAPSAQRYYAEIAADAEKLTLSYRPGAALGTEADKASDNIVQPAKRFANAEDAASLAGFAARGDPQGYAAALQEKLRSLRKTEMRVGYCMAGPHRDDIEILLGGQPGRVYASQGQQRSIVLALKLAEADVIGEVLEEKPVMLLDDVLSELDDTRQAYLLRYVGGGQTIVTTCDGTAFCRTDGKVLRVQNGRVEPNDS